jgi:hypothetical protein
MVKNNLRDFPRFFIRCQNKRLQYRRSKNVYLQHYEEDRFIYGGRPFYRQRAAVPCP